MCCCTDPPELGSRPSCGHWRRNTAARRAPCCAARPRSPNPISPSSPWPTSSAWSWTRCPSRSPPPSAPPWSRRSPAAASPPSSATASPCAWRCCPPCAPSPHRARPRRRRRPPVAGSGQRRTPRLRRPPPGRHPGADAVRGADRGPTRSTTAICARPRRTPSPSGWAPFPAPSCPTLLDHRGYAGLPRSTVRDIHRTSGGNALFALELGRALAESPTPPRPGEPLPVPTSLRALVLNRLEMLSEEARRTLLVASAGARPTPALLHAAGRDNAEAETAQAAELGLLATDPEGPTVRFAHPLDLRRAVRRGARRRSGGPRTPRCPRPPPTRSNAPGTWPWPPPAPTRRWRRGSPRPPPLARDRGAPSVAAQLGLLAAPAHPGRRRAGPGGAAAGGRRGRDHGGRAGPRPGHRPRGADPGRPRPRDRVRAWIIVIDTAGPRHGGGRRRSSRRPWPTRATTRGCSPWSTTSWPGAPCSCRATSPRRRAEAAYAAGLAAPGRRPAHRAARAGLPGPDARR